jgi:zinc protease
VLVVDRPEAAQTQLQLGHVSVPRSAPGFTERVLLNTILGGSFTSRLNLNLREHHGITYGVRSSFVRRTGPGPFLVRAAVDTDKAGLATRETLGEIERLRENGVTDEELRDAQQFLIGVFPYTVETVGDLAQRLEDLVVYDLPDDHFNGHADRLGAVTTAGVHKAAQQHLHPEDATIVAVGPAKILEPQLAAFGAVEVVTP